MIFDWTRRRREDFYGKQVVWLRMGFIKFAFFICGIKQCYAFKSVICFHHKHPRLSRQILNRLEADHRLTKQYSIRLKRTTALSLCYLDSRLNQQFLFSSVQRTARSHYADRERVSPRRGNRRRSALVPLPFLSPLIRFLVGYHARGRYVTRILDLAIMISLWFRSHVIIILQGVRDSKGAADQGTFPTIH